MKRKADASPGGDGNNESALNAGLPGTTCRRPHNKRSVSFQDDRILDEVELEKDKASLERRGGSPSSSFSQVVTHLGVNMEIFDLIYTMWLTWNIL